MGCPLCNTDEMDKTGAILYVLVSLFGIPPLSIILTIAFTSDPHILSTNDNMFERAGTILIIGICMFVLFCAVKEGVYDNLIKLKSWDADHVKCDIHSSSTN